MKNPRAESPARRPAPIRPPEERGGKSPVMGRGDIQKKLAKFKNPKSRKPALRPAHLAPEKPPAATKPASSKRSDKASERHEPPVSSLARAKPALPAQQSSAQAIQRASGSNSSKPSNSASPKRPSAKSVPSRRGAPSTAPALPPLKLLQGWLDDTKLALESPHANTLEQLGARGSLGSALGYVAVSATLTALLVFRIGWKGMLATLLLSLLAYASFVFVTYVAALRQDGDGKLESFGYAVALFWAPLAPFTALLPFIFGAAWIPAAALVQIFTTVFYALRVLNGTVWLSFSGQWNALTAGIAASSLLVLVSAFTVFSGLLHG